MLRTLLTVLLILGCTKSSLEPIPPPPPPELDNLLTIRGEVCSEPPDIAPFPVKILFAIDQSASLQCTDPENRRFVALNRVFNQLSSLPNAFFWLFGLRIMVAQADVYARHVKAVHVSRCKPRWRAGNRLSGRARQHPPNAGAGYDRLRPCAASTVTLCCRVH